MFFLLFFLFETNNCTLKSKTPVGCGHNITSNALLIQFFSTCLPKEKFSNTTKVRIEKQDEKPKLLLVMPGSNSMWLSTSNL